MNLKKNKENKKFELIKVFIIIMLIPIVGIAITDLFFGELTPVTLIMWLSLYVVFFIIAFH